MAVSPATVVGPNHRVRTRTTVTPPVAGLLGGLGAGLALEWAAHASRTFDGVLGFGDHVGEPVGLTVATLLGLLLGLLLAAGLRAEVLRATVTDRRITLRWGDARVSVPRHLVRTVVLSTDLVLLGGGTVELARVRCDLDRAELRRALARHGFPTPITDDPHAAAFRPWSTAPGSPGRPVAEQPHRPVGDESRQLLEARARALSERAYGDAELLRRQLTARGVMVRDVAARGTRTQQQWRPVLPEDDPPEASAHSGPLPTGSVPVTTTGDHPEGATDGPTPASALPAS